MVLSLSTCPGLCWLQGSVPVLCLQLDCWSLCECVSLPMEEGWSLLHSLCKGTENLQISKRKSYHHSFKPPGMATGNPHFTHFVLIKCMDSEIILQMHREDINQNNFRSPIRSRSAKVLFLELCDTVSGQQGYNNLLKVFHVWHTKSTKQSTVQMPLDVISIKCLINFLFSYEDLSISVTLTQSIFNFCCNGTI